MYNILDLTGIVLETQTEPKFVKWQKNGMVALCKKEQADGVVSSDGETIYALFGKNIPIGAYQEVTLEEKSVDKEIVKLNSDVSDLMEAQADIYEMIVATQENQIAIMESIADLYEAKTNSAIE